MLRLLVLIIVGWAGMAPGAVDARSLRGDVLWHDQFDLAGGDDLGMSMAVDDGRVVVVGSTRNAAGNLDFLVRAVDAKSGLLLWQDQVDIAGADDAAIAIVMDGQRVVVAGSSTQSGANPSMLLRSYHPKTGRLEWEVRSPNTFVTGVGMDDGRVVIVGLVPSAGSPFVGGPSVIRAFKAKGGIPLWEDNSVPGGQYLAHQPGNKVAILGDTALILTTITDSTQGGFRRCVVRSYHAPSGHLTWESRSGAGTCRGTAIAADRQHVFVVGQTGPMEDDFHIRTFDAKTGEELWRRQSFIFSGRENAAVAVDVERRLVFVAGWRFAATGSDHDVFLVQAYEADTGELRWQDAFETSGRCLCRARDIVADKGRVVAVGDGSGGREWLVRAYDASDGEVLWHDEFLFAGIPPSPPENAILGPRAVAVMGGRVFVSGSGVNDAGDGDIVVRAYDVK